MYIREKYGLRYCHIYLKIIKSDTSSEYIKSEKKTLIS